MESLSVKVVLVFAAAMGPIAIEPAYAASGSGDATVEVLEAHSLTKTSDLSFGSIIPSASAGSIRIAEDGTHTCDASLTCFGTTTAGAFSILGRSGETVSVALDSDTITLTNGASASISGKISTNTKRLTLDAGSAKLKIVASLDISANQAIGSYKGQYSVSVNYQ